MLSDDGLRDLADRCKFRFWVQQPVRFADLDPNNHVNNVVVLSYVEEARIAIRTAILDGMTAEAQDLSWVVGGQSIRYLRPISYPCELDLGVAVSGIGRTSFQLAYGVFKDDACYATAISQSICVSAQDGRPVPLSDAIRARLDTFSGTE